jgi:prophage maintenance system killer protein
MNGYRLKVEADDGESLIVNEVISKKIDIETIAAWLEDRMKEVQ